VLASMMPCAQQAPRDTDPTMLEQVVTVVTSDNLDLGCTVIERSATDKVAITHITRTYISCMTA
jgi:hypothetical protein